MFVKKRITIFFITTIVLISGTVINYAADIMPATNIEQISNEIGEANEIVDLLKIIEEATKSPKKEQLIVEQIDLEYMTSYENDESIPKGQMQVLVEGRDGIREIITRKTYRGEELILEELASEKIIKSSINKVVLVGTMKVGSISNYKIKKGDTVYVTSFTLNVKEEPNIESDKRGTLLQYDELKVLEVESEWARINSKDLTGWVKLDCITKRVPESDSSGTGQYTKAQLMAKLKFSMDLSKPSGLSLEQFKKVLGKDSKDKNKIFEQNAEIFYYIEQQYKINGVFVAAVGIHESGFGTSKICLDKNNLFGYGAFDRDPYNNAYEFSTYAEGIDLVARIMVKYYLNSEGKTIYDGQAASGKYYNGNTLSGVNKRYATDSKWANGVYKWMEYLYGKL